MEFTEIDGLKIHYHTVEEASPEGQHVLYVHGTGCNGRLWQRHMAEIADRHEPVAIDLPGHGGSEGLGFRGVADYGHFVVELADTLGWERFVVAGHSLGGGVALAVAIYHPHRLSGMMLIDTGARLRVHPDILEHSRRVAQGQPLPADPRRGFASGTPLEVVEATQALIADTDPRVTYRDWIADDSCDFLSRVREIEVPTIAICGDEDPMTPVKYHQFLHDRMPNCQLRVIEGAGHWPYIEQPAAFDQTVREFLEELPRRLSR